MFKTKCVLHFALLFAISHSSCVAQVESWTVASPGGEVVLSVSLQGGLTFSASYGGGEVAEVGPMGLSLSGDKKLQGETLADVRAAERRGVMKTSLGEWAEHADRYNELVVELKQGDDALRVEFRAYDEGFAYRYVAKKPGGVSVTADMAQMTMLRPLTYWSETGTESGYTERASNTVFTTLAPMFATSRDLSVVVGEAGNPAVASQMSFKVNNGAVTFVQQARTAADSLVVPWRVVMLAKTQIGLLSANYIMRSLCPETEADARWIRPGKVLRSLETGTDEFHTDSVLRAIDFAKSIDCRYVLLDAGWYGLGYSQEKNKNSVPTRPRPTLDVTKVVDHGRKSDVGILLYVNKVAWDNYDIDNTLDTYASWGAAGVKMGFVDGTTQQGMETVYKVVRGCADRQMVVNVHDNYRPTGTERTLPNLLTVEGVRGDENNPDAAHACRLPFARFLCGPADFTFVFRRPGDATNRRRTRGQQLGLLVCYFSPLQHVLWYGRAWQYAGKEDQLEFIRLCPTVWDETVPLKGEFGKYVAVARRRGDTWYVGAASDEARSLRIPLDFLPAGETFDVTTYEDDGAEGIRRSAMGGATSSSELSFSILQSGGAAAVIAPERGDSALPSIPAVLRVDISSTDGKVVVRASDTPLHCVRLYSLSGRLVAEERAADARYISVPAAGVRGVGVVEVESGEETTTARILIR